MFQSHVGVYLWICSWCLLLEVQILIKALKLNDNEDDKYNESLNGDLAIAMMVLCWTMDMLVIFLICVDVFVINIFVVVHDIFAGAGLILVPAPYLQACRKM